MSLAVVLAPNALPPIAVLRAPLVLASNAPLPIAVLLAPVLTLRALKPTAVQLPLEVSAFNTYTPIPVLFVAVNVPLPEFVPIKKLFPLSLIVVGFPAL